MGARIYLRCGRACRLRLDLSGFSLVLVDWGRPCPCPYPYLYPYHYLCPFPYLCPCLCQGRVRGCCSSERVFLAVVYNV